MPMRGLSDTAAEGEVHPALPIFFVLTFGFTWIAWLAAAALATPGSVEFFGLGGPVFLAGVFAPAIMALAHWWPG
jgi:hypothetical protein